MVSLVIWRHTDEVADKGTYHTRGNYMKEEKESECESFYLHYASA